MALRRYHRVCRFRPEPPLQQQHHQRRRQRDRQNRRRKHREGLRVGERHEQPPACPVKVKIGRKLTVISRSEKKIGRPTFAGLHDDRLPIGSRRRGRQAHVRVLDEHDRRVRQLTDGDGDATERHDVRGQSEYRMAMKENSTDSGSTTMTTSAERAWNRNTRQMIVTMTACWMSVLQGVDRPQDQLRPVVGRNQAAHLRQPQRRDLLLDGLDHLQRVGADPHHDDATDGFASAVEVGCATRIGPKCTMATSPSRTECRRRRPSPHSVRDLPGL